MLPLHRFMYADKAGNKIIVDEKSNNVLPFLNIGSLKAK